MIERTVIGFLFYCRRTEARPRFCLGVRAVALSSAAHSGVALIWPAQSRASPMGGERLKGGLPRLEEALPSRLDTLSDRASQDRHHRNQRHRYRRPGPGG